MEKQLAKVALLRRSLLDDIFKDLNSSTGKWLRRLLLPMAWPSVNRFAKIAASFDQYVERSGFREAMRLTLPNFVSGVETLGLDQVPANGPLLVVSNHPGTYDSLVIGASLPRNDLSIVAWGFPFLKNLPAARNHLIFTGPDAHSGAAVVRSAIRHLREGGALLIFPGGKVEPDPAALPGATEAISTWSPSLEFLLDKVPQTQVVITIVSGVLAPAFIENPLIRFWRGVRDPQMVAEVIQLVTQMLFPDKVHLTPRISFGVAITIDELRLEAGETRLLSSIVARARRELVEHCQVWGLYAQDKRLQI